jgi:hypothetical protein
MGTYYYDMVFSTEEDALYLIECELRRFPPAGYDTRFNRPWKSEYSGLWRVTGSRLRSCD